MPRADPLQMPEWKALHREAALVSKIIGSGATALGRASYGSGFGEYYAAFFGLSIGLERLAKLILVADHSIVHNGSLPQQSLVKKYGHKLANLIKQTEIIASRHGVANDYSKFNQPIVSAIANCLDAFSDASKGRYANFEAIGNPDFRFSDEPVNKWWNEVVEPILDIHYRGTQYESDVKNRAKIINLMIGDFTSVLQSNETGEMMSDITVSSERSGQTKLAQKYGRFYTLSIIRRLSYIFQEITKSRGYENGMEALFGHYEFFQSYIVEDSLLKTRKIWPLS